MRFSTTIYRGFKKKRMPLSSLLRTWKKADIFLLPIGYVQKARSFHTSLFEMGKRTDPFHLPPFLKGDIGGFKQGISMLPFNRKIKLLARGLRTNMTDAEQLIWSKVRRKQILDFQFYRQKNIGNFIVDFYCPKGKLVIEVDGGQHYQIAGVIKDRKRDDCLQTLGLTVLRFSDTDVLKNMEGVLQRIYEHLKTKSSLSLL